MPVHVNALYQLLKGIPKHPAFNYRMKKNAVTMLKMQYVNEVTRTAVESEG